MRSPAHLPFALRSAEFLDERLTRPGLIVLLLTGLWMAASRWTLALFWIRAALVLVVLVLILLYVVVPPDRTDDGWPQDPQITRLCSFGILDDPTQFCGWACSTCRSGRPCGIRAHARHNNITNRDRNMMAISRCPPERETENSPIANQDGMAIRCFRSQWEPPRRIRIGFTFPNRETARAGLTGRSSTRVGRCSVRHHRSAEVNSLGE